jgi:hypothetical protein
MLRGGGGTINRPVALALLGLGGCGGIAEESDYADSLARQECAKLERCSLGYFEATYSSEEDCLRERADEIRDNADALEDLDCEYVPEEAGRCVRRVSALSCEEWTEGEGGEACDLVYRCDQDEPTYYYPTLEEG